jgi:hypothetical protein
LHPTRCVNNSMKLKEWTKMEESENDSIRTVALVTLSALTLLYAGFQTFKGYYIDLGFINSLVLSIILTLAMFVLSMSMRHELKTGGNPSRLVLSLILYGLAALFSFFGNYNSFYTAFMRDSVIRNELQEKLIILEEQKASVAKVLADPVAEKRRNELEALVDQLKTQIQSAFEPGLGTKAQEILARIERLLGTQLTRLKPGDNSPQQLKIMADQYEALVSRALKKDELLNERRYIEKTELKLELMKNIDMTLADLKSDSVLMAESSDQVREQAKKHIQTAVSLYKEVGAQLKKFDPSYSYDPGLRLKNTNVGMISFSVESTFSNLGAPQTWFAFFLSLLVELFVPGLVFALTPRGGGYTRRNVLTRI